MIVVISAAIILSYLYQSTSLFYRKNIPLPFAMHLNKQELYMVKGEEYRLYINGINKRVSFSSTNFRVAGVNFNGRVFAYRTGKAFILAKVEDRVFKCRVTVIDINKETLKLKVGNTYKLEVIGAGGLLKWTSDNNEIASVTMLGKVKAKKKGRTVIRTTFKGKKLKCTVYVK
jgi:uncharacterized protein YjdB